MDMTKLIPLLADAFTTEDLIQKIIDGGNSYLENKSEETLRGLEFDCTLLCAKRAITISGGVDNLTKDLGHTKALHETDTMLRSIPGLEISGDQPSAN